MLSDLHYNMNSNEKDQAAFPNVKRRRKTLNLQIKLEIINRLERGESVSSVGRLFGLATSTIKTIEYQKERFKKIGKSCAAMNLTDTTLTNRSEIMVHMEKLLKDWCHSQHSNNILNTYTSVSTKAREILISLKTCYGEEFRNVEFTGSRGWYERFLRRNNMQCVQRKHKASGDEFDEQTKFLSHLETIIVDGNYSAQQVFNVSETALFWKRFPLNMCSENNNKFQDLKKSENRLSLLFGANASGDLKLKPLLVIDSNTQSRLGGYSKDLLPVTFKTNQSARVTVPIFEEWFLSYFIPEVEKFCKENTLVNKAVLILGNSPGFPPYFSAIHSHIKIVYLPKDTTIFQPMDLDIVSIFRAYYLQNMFVQSIYAVTGSEKLNFSEFYQSFGLKDAIDNIIAAWDEVSNSIINGSWKTLCPFLLSSFSNLKLPLEIMNDVKENILKMGKQFGFNIQVDDIDYVLSSHSEALVTDNLHELNVYKCFDTKAVQQGMKPFDSTTLNKFFSLLNKAMELISERDPNLERSASVCEKIRESCQSYVDVYNKKKIGEM